MSSVAARARRAAGIARDWGPLAAQLTGLGLVLVGPAGALWAGAAWPAVALAAGAGLWLLAAGTVVGAARTGPPGGAR